MESLLAILADSEIFAQAVADTFQTTTNSVDLGQLLTLSFIVVIGLLFSAVFSSSEVAVFSLSARMTAEDTERAKSDRPLQRILFMLEAPRRLLATI